MMTQIIIEHPVVCRDNYSEIPLESQNINPSTLILCSPLNATLYLIQQSKVILQIKGVYSNAFIVPTLLRL